MEYHKNIRPPKIMVSSSSGRNNPALGLNNIQINDDSETVKQLKEEINILKIEAEKKGIYTAEEFNEELVKSLNYEMKTIVDEHNEKTHSLVSENDSLKLELKVLKETMVVLFKNNSFKENNRVIKKDEVQVMESINRPTMENIFIDPLDNEVTKFSSYINVDEIINEDEDTGAKLDKLKKLAPNLLRKRV